jgi:hypothetical protein
VAGAARRRGGTRGRGRQAGAGGGRAWHRWRRARVRAARDQAATVDAGSDGQCWAGGVARFGCEWADRVREYRKAYFGAH